MRRIVGLALAAIGSIGVLAQVQPVAGAATAGSIVGATVPSATNLDVTTGCPSRTSGITDFGLVMPGSSSVTTSDCTIVFGSSNDTAMLKAFQSDGVGQAMVGYSTGDLDGSFAANGILVEDFGGAEGASSQTVLVQPDGKWVVGGSADGDFLVARFNPDGTLDTAGFNAPDGFIAVELSAGTDESIADLALQADGKIVAAGKTNGRIGVMRLRTDGTLDPGFSGGYVVHATPGVASEYARSVAVQSSGRIIVAGTGNDGTEHPLVVGFDSIGGLDTSFAAPDGYAFNTMGGRGAHAAVGDDDRIYVVNTYICTCSSVIRRWDPNGVPDGTWGGGGLILNRSLFDPGAALFSANKPVFAPSGDLLVTGRLIGTGSYNLMPVARIDASGSLDSGFGGDGAVVVDPGEEAFGIAVMEDMAGNVLVTGHSTAFAKQLHVARLTSLGALDSTFDDDGIVTVVPPDVTGQGTFAGSVVELHDSGSYLTANTSQTNAGGFDLVLAKFGGMPIPDFVDDPADVAGDDWATPGASLFGACLIAASNASAGATTWTVDAAGGADCADGDSDPWNAIVTGPGDTGAKVLASDGTGQAAATAGIRFGFRAAPNQAPGTYTAPITFEVVAPNA